MFVRWVGIATIVCVVGCEQPAAVKQDRDAAVTTATYDVSASGQDTKNYPPPQQKAQPPIQASPNTDFGPASRQPSAVLPQQQQKAPAQKKDAPKQPEPKSDSFKVDQGNTTHRNDN